MVDFNEKDEIMTEFETFQTKTAGLFAVGDANVGKYKQIITACGEWAKAALSAYEYLLKIKKWKKQRISHPQQTAWYSKINKNHH